MRKTMIAVAVVGAALLAGAATAKPGKQAAAPKATKEQVERGRYLVTVGGCGDCHTPMKFDPEAKAPVPDRSRILSGHPANAPTPVTTLSGQDLAVIGPTFTAFRLPFGVVFASNLTPDVETGIGGWTEDDFVTAMRTGLHLGKGRAILPPMPWPNVAAATDDDLKAMFAYLKSLPPVKNRVPDNQVAPGVYEGQAKTNEGIRRMLEGAKR